MIHGLHEAGRQAQVVEGVDVASWLVRAELHPARKLVRCLYPRIEYEEGGVSLVERIDLHGVDPDHREHLGDR